MSGIFFHLPYQNCVCEPFFRHWSCRSTKFFELITVVLLVSLAMSAPYGPKAHISPIWCITEHLNHIWPTVFLWDDDQKPREKRESLISGKKSGRILRILLHLLPPFCYELTHPQGTGKNPSSAPHCYMKQRLYTRECMCTVLFCTRSKKLCYMCM